MHAHFASKIFFKNSNEQSVTVLRCTPTMNAPLLVIKFRIRMDGVRQPAHKCTNRIASVPFNHFMVVTDFVNNPSRARNLESVFFVKPPAPSSLPGNMNSATGLDEKPWWPPPPSLVARAPAACSTSAVAYFSDPAVPLGPTKQVLRFVDPDADGMARASTAPTFLAAVEEAHASAVTALCSSLTCACVTPPEAAICQVRQSVPSRVPRGAPGRGFTVGLGTGPDSRAGSTPSGRAGPLVARGTTRGAPQRSSWARLILLFLSATTRKTKEADCLAL
jgi:hypothetical protein